MQGEILKVGDLVIDKQARSVSRSGEVLDLPDLSYRLLLSLVEHAPHRVDKDQLIEEAWQGMVVSDETLSQRIRLLRQVLGDDAREPRYVASIRNQGYRLIVPVTTSTETGETPAAPRELQGSAASGHARSISKSVIIISLGLVLVLALYLSSRYADPPRAAVDPEQSLAVLPFADMSPEGDSRYFADGIHEELLSRLSQINDLQVVSRTSVMPLRETRLSIPEIAGQLGVSVILEGSVRLMGNRVRITAQLIDGASKSHLWSENFERELTMENLFAIQAEVATAIADALHVELSGSDRSRLIRLPTENTDAYNAYLLGRYHTFQQTPNDLSLAINFLKQAIAFDDRFAEAWATLGWAYSFQGAGYGTLSPAEAYPKAREAALRSLSLNNELADAHSLYADILTWYDWDWQAAEREYLAAMEFEPFASLGYSILLSSQMRHAEALSLVEGFLEQFPDDGYIHINAAWRYLNARDYERALIEAELANGHTDVLGASGWALLELSRLQEAMEAFEQDALINPANPSAISNLAVGSIRSGDRERGGELLQVLLGLSEKQFVPPDLVAAIYFELDNADEGFAWLDKALEVRSRGLVFLQIDHVYDRYRSDPRYLRLVKEMGFTSP